nr:hypothetical protein B0A51_03475 [Rachicladosporium sp. CCFEE 5018]
MSAIAEEDGNGITFEPVKVLIALQDRFDLCDMAGPAEVFSWAMHDKKDDESKAFRVALTGPADTVTSNQGITVKTHFSYTDALARLPEIDLLVIVGGGTEQALKAKSQPIALIKAFVAQQVKNPARERTLLSICTGSMLLAETGLLAGLSATTHPDYITKMEILCSKVSQRDMADRCDVMQDARYVVNNLRFDLGENEDENPYILTRKQYKEKRRQASAAGMSPIEERPNGGTRRMSSARKGSISYHAANTRRESVLKRANLRLGGLRVITTSGVLSGVDGALYMVGALVDDEAAEEVARKMCHTWKKGVVNLVLASHFTSTTVAAIYYTNGSSNGIAKIEGSPAYKHLLRQQTWQLPEPYGMEPIRPQYMPWAYTGWYKQGLYEYLPPWLSDIQPDARTDVVAPMLAGLTVAFTADTGTNNTAVFVTFAAQPQSELIQVVAATAARSGVCMPFLRSDSPAGFLADAYGLSSIRATMSTLRGSLIRCSCF